MNRRFGGTYRFNRQGDELVDSCHPDDGSVTSTETSVLTGATWRNIPDDDILHSHRRENLKSYVALTGLAL
jgi:hypothetical protein